MSIQRLAICIAILMVNPAGYAASDMSVRVSAVKAGSKTFRVSMVKASLDSYRVKVGLAYDKVGATSSVGAIAKRSGAQAAINGTFFNAYTSASYKTPYNTIVTNGVLRHAGVLGTSLGFDDSGNYMLERVMWSSRNGPSGGVPEFWQNAKEVMGCGPTLIMNGRIVLDARSEGFRDAKILSGSAPRSAVGLTSDRHIILLTCKATMQELAQIMLALGAVDAMNLDGGASSSLWVRGRYITGPGRAVSNALLLIPISRSVRSPLPGNALANIEKYDAKAAWEALNRIPQVLSGYRLLIDSFNTRRIERMAWVLSVDFKWDCQSQDPQTGKSVISTLDYARSLSKIADNQKKAGICPRWMYRFMLCKPYNNNRQVVILAYRLTLLPYTPYNPVDGKGNGTMEAVEDIWSADTQSGAWQLMYERSRIANSD